MSGQSGRRPNQQDPYDDALHREGALDRIERLTQTATALGSGGDYHEGGSGADDLNAVADELDRLLSDRGDAGETRQARPGPAGRPPVQRTSRDAGGGIDEVMGALDRLDRQVQGFAGTGADGGDRLERRPQSGPRPGRYAIDSLRSDADQFRADPMSDRYGQPRRLEEDQFDYGEPEAVADYGHRRDTDARAQRDATMHVYKDLGRRIDALRAPQEQAFNQVREELGSLRDALGGLSRGTNETVGRQNTELRRLTDLVERLRNDKKSEQHAREIRKEVADLKAMVGRTNVEGALETLEHGYSHILQRLDELSRASLDPRILQGVTVRLNEIEDAFASLPRSEHLLVLEDRVVAIAGRMEELLQRKTTADIAPLRSELQEVRGFIEQIDIKGLVEGIDDRMKFVSGRLDDLEVLAREQRGLDQRLSDMEQRMPGAETISRLQGRLEDIAGMMADERAAPVDHQHLQKVDHRLNEIVDRLERMEQADPLPSADTEVFRVLEQRLEAIAGKIDVIEKKASRPVPILDAAAMKAGGGADTKFLSQLQDRLNDLTTRLDQPTDTVTTSDLDKLRQEIASMRVSVEAPASTEALERRITDLAQIVSEGGEDADDNRIEQLGVKVAELAAQIEATSANSLSINQLTPVLDRIENGLLQTRNDVAGIAKKAAEEVISKAPKAGEGQYETDISDLQNDLKRLLDAAEGSDKRTKNTFDSVKSVLGSVTERLDKLERVDGPGAAAAATDLEGPYGTNPAEPYKEWSKVFERPQSQPKTLADLPRQDDIEPGRRPQERQRDRKADFIAAARRAAQAASAEATLLERKQGSSADTPQETDQERGKARAGWLRKVLKRDNGTDATADSAIEDDLELSADDVADKPEQTETAPVLPGDRPAPEAVQGGGGRRRAVLYAAAAVVLLIGTLQVFRTVTSVPDDADQVAAVSQTDVVAVDARPAETKPDIAATVDVAATEASEKMPGDELGQTAKAADTAASSGAGNAPARPDPAKASMQEPAISTALPDNVQPAATGGRIAAEQVLAFTPPSGVAGNFTNENAGNAQEFVPSTPTAGADIIAGLPPEGTGPMALRSAAASGNPAAQFLIGVNFTEGNGVAADLEKAAVWYQKAAGKGLAPAQYRLASLYEKGRGVDRDLAKAKAWYGKAAEAGNAKAMHNLAVLYAEGGGEAPDYAEAAKWFESAANFGVKDSLFNLGILYAGGIGVDKDLVASYKWFAIAAAQGDPEAAKRRDDVANMMDQEALANGRLAVENFSLKTPLPAANKVTLEPEWAESSTPGPQAASAPAPLTDTTTLILEAQDKLNYLGFDTGTPDGQMGPRTRSAIRAFQRSLGLPETGEVDGRLIEELKSQAI